MTSFEKDFFKNENEKKDLQTIIGNMSARRYDKRDEVSSDALLKQIHEKKIHELVDRIEKIGILIERETDPEQQALLQTQKILAEKQLEELGEDILDEIDSPSLN